MPACAVHTRDLAWTWPICRQREALQWPKWLPVRIETGSFCPSPPKTVLPLRQGFTTISEMLDVHRFTGTNKHLAWCVRMQGNYLQTKKDSNLDKAMAPVEQKQVVFFDDEKTAVLVQLKGEEKIYAPVKPICEFLGVSWTGQLRRINRDAVLAEEIRSVNVTFTEPR